MIQIYNISCKLIIYSYLLAFCLAHRERDKRIRELEDEVKRLNEYIVQLREQAGRRIRELQAEISLLTDQLTDKVNIIFYPKRILGAYI